MNSAITRKKGKHIQLFRDDCEICEKHQVNVEIGKCTGCRLEVFQINEQSKKIEEKIWKYDIAIHPTTIIDEEIKVEGMPPFLWLCGDDFYIKLKEKYPLKTNH